ncbi:calmodulin-4-like isoform X2 [Haliotis cracherodii]
MLGIILLTVVASALGAPATPLPTMPDLTAAMTTSFNSFDLNKNGHLELSEFYALFDTFDTNHDHEMSIQEYIQSTNVTATIARAVFKFLDKNHDNSFSRTETNGIFRIYDTNNNGVITFEEFTREYKKIANELFKELSQGQTIPASTAST